VKSKTRLTSIAINNFGDSILGKRPREDELEISQDSEQGEEEMEELSNGHEPSDDSSVLAEPAPSKKQKK